MHALLTRIGTSDSDNGGNGVAFGSGANGGNGSSKGSVDCAVGGNGNENVEFSNEIRPLTAIMRQSSAPLFPTIDAPGSYLSVSHLIERGFIQNHHQIGSGVKGWNNSKTDPQRWSQLSKVYERVRWKIHEQKLDPVQRSSWITAASLLDSGERNGLTIPKYVKWLRDNVSEFKKRAPKRKRS